MPVTTEEDGELVDYDEEDPGPSVQAVQPPSEPVPRRGQWNQPFALIRRQQLAAPEEPRPTRSAERRAATQAAKAKRKEQEYQSKLAQSSQLAVQAFERNDRKRRRTQEKAFVIPRRAPVETAVTRSPLEIALDNIKDAFPSEYECLSNEFRFLHQKIICHIAAAAEATEREAFLQDASRQAYANRQAVSSSSRAQASSQ